MSPGPVLGGILPLGAPGGWGGQRGGQRSPYTRWTQKGFIHGRLRRAAAGGRIAGRSGSAPAAASPP